MFTNIHTATTMNLAQPSSCLLQWFLVLLHLKLDIFSTPKIAHSYYTLNDYSGFHYSPVLRTHYFLFQTLLIIGFVASTLLLL